MPRPPLRWIDASSGRAPSRGGSGRESALFARGRPADPGRRVYDQMLAGHDIVGLLGHLTDVFFEAQMQLRKRLRASAASSDHSAQE